MVLNPERTWESPAESAETRRAGHVGSPRDSEAVGLGCGPEFAFLRKSPGCAAADFGTILLRALSQVRPT